MVHQGRSKDANLAPPSSTVFISSSQVVPCQASRRVVVEEQMLSLEETVSLSSSLCGLSRRLGNRPERAWKALDNDRLGALLVALASTFILVSIYKYAFESVDLSFLYDVNKRLTFV